MSDLFRDLDARDFTKRINIFDKRVREVGKARMLDNVRDLEKESGKLCPVDEGQLIDTVVSEVRMYPTVIEGRVSANKPYAVAVHEGMKPAIPAFGKAMVSGPTTRAKPPTAFGPAGGKYIERPLRGKFKQYFQHIASGIAGLR